MYVIDNVIKMLTFGDISIVVMTIILKFSISYLFYFPLIGHTVIKQMKYFCMMIFFPFFCMINLIYTDTDFSAQSVCTLSIQFQCYEQKLNILLLKCKVQISKRIHTVAMRVYISQTYFNPSQFSFPFSFLAFIPVFMIYQQLITNHALCTLAVLIYHI